MGSLVDTALFTVPCDLYSATQYIEWSHKEVTIYNNIIIIKLSVCRCVISTRLHSVGEQTACLQMHLYSVSSLFYGINTMLNLLDTTATVRKEILTSKKFDELV